MKKVAIVLSGCGFQDGTEITECVAFLVKFSEKNVSYDAFSVDKNFSPVPSDKNGSSRNCLAESFRIYRKPVRNIAELKVEEFDGLAFPGGFGVALHLCDWAEKGAQCDVHPQVKKVIESFHNQHKPILAVCIAPALIARVLGKKGVSVTIGNNEEVAQQIQVTGAEHIRCDVDDFVTDRENKIITSPAYMQEALPHQVFKGIGKAISEFIEMA